MPDPTPERLAELRRIAEAATPGPWISPWDQTHDDPEEYGFYSADGEKVAGITWIDGPQFECSEADAHHIAAFDPTTVLALLDRIEELERQVHLANNLAMSAEQLVKAWEANEGDLTLYLDDLRHDLMDYYTRYGTGDSETPSDEQPGAVIALTQDDCLILMWGLIDPDEYVCTGDGQTIPPSEDTPEMRATREHYRRLMERIIDVGAGLTGGANDA